MIDSSSTKESIAEEANKVIQSITNCVERGEGKGTCHVFLDHSNLCACGKIDLNKERMK